MELNTARCQDPTTSRFSGCHYAPTKPGPLYFLRFCPHLVTFGLPAPVFGPDKPHLFHKPDEYIHIHDLETAAAHYENIILSFLT